MPGSQYIALSAGSSSACALDREGRAWCWGDDPTQPGESFSFRTLDRMSFA